jgi:hypothetical protein
MLANTARIVVGRLLEIRVAAGYRSVEDVDALFAQVGSEIDKFPSGTRHVAVVDWRFCPVMSPAAAEYLTAQMAGKNSRTERSAALARQDSPIAVLQFVRVIREANHPARRLFFEEDEVYSWLSEVLLPAERGRLRAFLSEQVAAA